MQRLIKKARALYQVEKLIDMGIWQPKRPNEPLRDESPERESDCTECKSEEKCRECMKKIFLSSKIPRMHDKRRLNELMNGIQINGDEQMFRKFILQDWARLN
ncbi:hypothetical protein QAD02_013403 [Eretmocerus hayati]|uniref:Uncharacterized protein n=1 Tax=Eretmocerus hayati TaxID=131215 RepID=A0ACC2P2F2_9HYME|nr:hypothetical protein QAD02_013403 [Eretmocerus hayati]